MAGHDAPGMNFQTFILLTESYTFQKNVFVFVPDKYIKPAYNRKTHEI